MSSNDNRWIGQLSPFTDNIPDPTLAQESQLRASIEPSKIFNDFDKILGGFSKSVSPPYDRKHSTNPVVDHNSQYEEPNLGPGGCYNLPTISPPPSTQQSCTQVNNPTTQGLDEQFSVDEEDDEEDGQSHKSVKRAWRQKGEVKTINGQLYQREPGWTEYAPAVYHSDIRAELIAEASHGGQLKYPRRRARGNEPTNITSYLSANHDWGEDRGHRPEVCFQYEKRDWTTPDYEPDIWVRGGKFVIDHSGRRMQTWRNLPSTISSEESGMFLEAWRREDSRIGLDDMMARMPKEFLKGTKRRGMYGVSTINMRMNRFRINACIKSWNPRVGTPTIDAYLDYLLPKDCHAANSTKGFRDLTKAESAIAWVLNKGSRQYNMSDITDKERTKRMKATDIRIKKLIEEDHKRDIMTVYMTRDELSDRVGSLHIPPVTSGVYKSKRKALEDITEDITKEAEAERPLQIKRQKSTAPTVSVKATPEWSMKRATKFSSSKRSASNHSAAKRSSKPSTFPPPPPVTPFEANTSQMEHAIVPGFENMNFSSLSSPLYSGVEGVTTNNVGDWLANPANFQPFSLPNHPDPEKQVTIPSVPFGDFGLNSFTTPSYSSDLQTMRASSRNLPPSARSSKLGSLAQSSPNAPIYLAQTHKPTIPSEACAIHQALETTRQHIKSYFGHEIELPGFNPNKSYGAQYHGLVECFRKKWVSVYGDDYQVPELEGRLPVSL